MSKETPPSTETFEPEAFLRALLFLDVQLFNALRDLSTALRAANEEQILALTMEKVQPAALYAVSEEQILALTMEKVRLIDDILRHLGKAYEASDGEVCDMPEFDPQCERRYLNLSVPYKGHILWAKAIKHLEDIRTEEANDIQQIQESASNSAETAYTNHPR
jgi:hypothetical protein